MHRRQLFVLLCHCWLTLCLHPSIPLFDLCILQPLFPAEDCGSLLGQQMVVTIHSTDLQLIYMVDEEWTQLKEVMRELVSSCLQSPEQMISKDCKHINAALLEQLCNGIQVEQDFCFESFVLSVCHHTQPFHNCKVSESHHSQMSCGNLQTFSTSLAEHSCIPRSRLIHGRGMDA